MAVEFEKLIKRTPLLFHLTYVPSLERIRRTMTLESAGRLLELGNMQEWLRKRRERMLRFTVDDDNIVLTDQRPLTEGNIDFQGDWVVADLIEAVNKRVFFWRGDHSGLLMKDRGHYGSYNERGEQLAFLRIPFADAVAIADNSVPEYCRYNSGGPRCSGGKKSPRGPGTFVEARQADFTLGKVREVVFQDVFHLPTSTEVCFGNWCGPWKNFQQPKYTSGNN